jgi:coenzyme F420-0:L-glutamate ligase/coenzyme F420-1:gamma-L-glutamate ligase
MESSVQLLPLKGIPEIAEGQDVALLLWEAMASWVQNGDVLVVTHKIVSKAEGQIVRLAEVEPSETARRWGERWKKDPRQIEVVLRESAGIVRMERGIIISRTRHGLVCANAGVDRSNNPNETVCLLPQDPDASARKIYSMISERAGFPIPVLISDSFGRPWRNGIVNIAIGVAGMEPFTDYRGQDDAHGFRMEASIMGTADALCAASELVMGKVDQVPAAIVRGAQVSLAPEATSRPMLRTLEEDMFR